MIATYPLTYKFTRPARTAVPAPVPALALLEHLSLADVELLLSASLTLLIAHGLASAADVHLLAELGAVP